MSKGAKDKSSKQYTAVLSEKPRTAKEVAEELGIEVSQASASLNILVGLHIAEFTDDGRYRLPVPSC